MRAKIPQLTEALIGHFDAGHAQLARTMLHRLELIEDALAELNAVAHSMLVSAYFILSPDEPYRDLGADRLARRNDEAHTRRLVARLERLDHTVVLGTAV